MYNQVILEVGNGQHSIENILVLNRVGINYNMKIQIIQLIPL